MNNGQFGGALVLLFAAACGSPSNITAVDGGDGGSSRGIDGSGNAGFGAEVSADGGPTAVGDAGSFGVTNLCADTAIPPAGYATCRTQQDCAGMGDGRYQCASSPPTNQSTCVGSCPSPVNACGVDTDCASGEACVQPPGGCCPAGNKCMPACTATSCGIGMRCNTSGHCEVTPCTDGFLCGTGYVCAPSRPSNEIDVHGCANASCATDGFVCGSGLRCQAGDQTDLHGCSAISCADGFVCWKNSDCDPTSNAFHHCVTRACKTDADCDCGACVVASCQDSLFVCVPPAKGPEP